MIHFRYLLFMAFTGLSCAAGQVHAQQHIMTEEEIRKDVTSATISGRYTFGGFFTEFHSPDGRVLGHNGWTKNTDACWTTKAPNQVCYS